MPSKSPAQHRLMSAVAHSPKFAKKTGISQSVGKEYSEADKAKAATKVLRKHNSPKQGY